jgi:SAM-dependent methyltransferase
VSRLEALADALYYPTPPRVAAAIARHLTPENGGLRGAWTVRALDPCAGTGEALALIARALGAETFGIELHDERARAAGEQLDRVLHTSAFSTRLAHGAFSLLFANPPYDVDTEQRRLEHAFLTKLSRTLYTGGVLVYIVPQRRLGISARYLASHYRDIRIYRFPDPEFKAFGQIVLFARKKAQGAADPALQARVDAWSEGEQPPLPDEPDAAARVPVPAVRSGEVPRRRWACGWRLALLPARRCSCWCRWPRCAGARCGTRGRWRSPRRRRPLRPRQAMNEHVPVLERGAVQHAPDEEDTGLAYL